MKKTLYMCKVDYLIENGFSGHVNNVNYWYRKMYNCRRGKSATKRLEEHNKSLHITENTRE
jgi:hypothetical protein